jgi:O-antigen/teichoic acid export membrane protein
MTLSLFILVFFVIFGFSYLALISNLFDLNIFISWIIYSFAIQLNIFFSNYSSLLKSFNKIDELNFNNIISNIGLFSFSILFLFLGYGLIGLSLALFIKAILNRVLSLFQLSKFKELTKNNNFSHIVKNYKFIRDALNFIWPLLWKDGLISLSAYFSSQAVVLFSPFFLTLDQIATYSIGLQLFSAISSISSSMYRSLQTNIQYSFAKNDVKSFLRLTSLSNMIYIFLYLSGSFIFMVISEKFFLLLLDSKIYEIPLLVLVFLYVFIQGNHNMFCSFISNTNNLPYIKSYLISSLFGTFLSLLLISSFDIGPLGLVLGQIIPQLFYNGWYWVSYFLKNYNIKLKEFYFLGLKSLVKSIFSK